MLLIVHAMEKPLQGYVYSEDGAAHDKELGHTPQSGGVDDSFGRYE